MIAAFSDVNRNPGNRHDHDILCSPRFHPLAFYAAPDAGGNAGRAVHRQVAGDAAEVHSITRPGAEVHDYQPTPRDIVKTQKADLILWNGMNLERLFRRFFDQLHDVPSAVVTKGIEPMPIRDGGPTTASIPTPGCRPPMRW